MLWKLALVILLVYLLIRYRDAVAMMLVAAAGSLLFFAVCFVDWCIDIIADVGTFLERKKERK